MGRERTRALARKAAEGDAAKGKTPDKTPAPAPKSPAPATGQVSKLPSPAAAARMLARAEERGKATPPAKSTKSEEKEKKGPVQKKVAISEPGDKFEKEADAVASRVKRDDQVPAGAISRMDESAGGVGEAQREAKVRDKEESAKKSTEEKLKEAPVQRATADTSPEVKSEEDKLRAEEKSLIGPVQKKAVPVDDKKKEAPVQRAANGGATMEDAAEQAIASKGAGQPLVQDTRDRLERRMGADLSEVRVHDGSAAQGAARDLNARAFTHGRDIWLGAGESQRDVGLMAHEVTHVMQQTGAAQRKVHRAPAPVPAGEPSLDGNAITIPTLKIPAIKATHVQGKSNVPLAREERTDQRATWKEKVKDSVTTKLPGKLAPVPGIRKSTAGIGAEDDKGTSAWKTYILQIGSRDNYIIGTAASLADEFTIPRWDPDGDPRPMDVDHKLELQLGGKADDPTNFQLLDASANRSSGSIIARQLNQAVEKATKPEVGQGKRWPKAPKASDVLAQGLSITVGSFDATLPLGKSAKPNAVWDISTVKEVEGTFAKVKPLSAAEAAAKDLIGSPTKLVVFPASGGKPKGLPGWKANQSTKELPNSWLKGLKAASITYVEGGKDNKVTGVVGRWNTETKIVEDKTVTFALQEVAGIPFTAVIDRSSILPSMKFMEFKALSPIEFNDAGIDPEKGIYARGKLRPSLPILKDLEIDIGIEGEEAYLSKTFVKDDFNLPGPLKVTEAGLTLTLGTSGIAATGTIAIEIDRVGKGMISAKASDKGLDLEGTFDFDSKLFDKASIAVWYRNREFGAEGNVTIGEGKVRGIKSASLTVTIAKDSIVATGSVKPSIPGIEQADLALHHTPEQGLVITGHVELRKDIPGIAGGAIDVTVAKPPGAEDYKVKAIGTATPKIPGVNAQITVTYDDGAFDIVGTAAYQKGMLSGALTIGATNRPVGEDGNPAGAPPEKGADKITLYGGGSLSLKIAPWLQATATVKLKPNGEIEVTGRIGLPSVLEIFPEKRLDKNIFKVGIDIPIVGVSVVGQRIGIFANITGGLDLSAGIGPGQLQDLHLEVTYNPDHEDQTHVSGAAKLHVPAQAGLRMFVRGSLGVGIPIVSASAGLEIGGGIGLEGALDAGVNVDWTPTTGLDIQASAEIYVQPKLKFDITGFVLVEADLFISTVELYSKRWKLAALEYGSDLKFGLKLPIHYQEGKPFDISFSDVEFITPSISAEDVLSGLIKKIA